ncbi:hypothetical protein EVAR_39092_1 [Eumeta japonica]|uniref:Uncharacterized protein n=1 Tax=Eumeta variegata TaxID=151549 RepID=A0A4C1WQF9_EUMVA|nr:hypothetical protein EVAR_39092_1 [Eumeta japonica]
MSDRARTRARAGPNICAGFPSNPFRGLYLPLFPSPADASGLDFPSRRTHSPNSNRKGRAAHPRADAPFRDVTQHGRASSRVRGLDPATAAHNCMHSATTVGDTGMWAKARRRGFGRREGLGCRGDDSRRDRAPPAARGRSALGTADRNKIAASNKRTVDRRS